MQQMVYRAMRYFAWCGQCSLSVFVASCGLHSACSEPVRCYRGKVGHESCDCSLKHYLAACLPQGCGDATKSGIYNIVDETGTFKDANWRRMRLACGWSTGDGDADGAQASTSGKQQDGKPGAGCGAMAIE